MVSTSITMPMSPSRAPTSSITVVAAASFVGTAIEWYDFFLYGTSAVLVFPKLFFPASDPVVGTLLALATFATTATASAARRCSA
jgi:MHS family shikimate/dehydroshikimate transporter-like MFS transporter